MNDNHFYDLKNKLMFNAMKKLDLLDEPIDVVTVKTQLCQELLMAGGVEYLSNLFNGIAKEEIFKSYESSLINEYKVRKIKELSRQLNDVKSSRDLKVVTETINEINNVLEQGDKNEFNLMDTLLEIETEVNESKSDVSGVRTALKNWTCC